jgi:SAM-dependent methyltransferase
MLETNDSEINVDRLMHEIRELVERQQPGPDENVSTSLPSSLIGESRSHAQNDSSSLTLQPEFHPRHDNQYQVNDLLKYHGGDFVRNAYRAILRREPDAAGLAHHLENLASGRFNKIDVLSSLRFSPEGERAHVNIAGLAWPAAIRRLGRVPLIGYLIQSVIAMVRLPIFVQHQRQLEFYLGAQQQRIVDHANEVHKQLAEALAQTSAKALEDARMATDQQQVIELMVQQQQQDLAQGQVEFKTRLADIRQHLDQCMAMITRQVEEQAEQLLLRQNGLSQQVEEQTQQLIRRQQLTQEELVMQERRLMLFLEEAGERPPSEFNHSLVQLMTKEEDHVLDPLYASFEDQFRGDREEVKTRLRVYLPILMDARIEEDVLDIGCGRGEWLEILKNEGVGARGVDHNRVFVERCRQIGLDVVEEDALVYLRNLPDQSLTAITGFHLVEHLPFDVLIRLLDEIVRTLRSGGLLILETPNPENFMVGSHSFYTDPTHRNPIPSPTLQFLLESRGLGSIKVMKLRPWDAAKIEGDTEIIKRFNEYFYSAPDYGIIGWKV